MAKISPRAQDFINAVFSRKREERLEARAPRSRRTGYAKSGMSTQSDLDGVGDYLRTDQNYLARLVDCEHMDQYPELASVLDIWADDATQPDIQDGRTVEIEADDEQVKKLLEECFYGNLEIDEHIWPMTRGLCKMGNELNELLVTNRGVIGLDYLSPAATRRIEDPDEGLLGFTFDPTGQVKLEPAEFKALMEQGVDTYEGVTLFDDWQVVHMRLRSVNRGSHYGYSVLEPARWIWKRLVMLEDASMAHFLTRSPGRLAIYVDTGQRPPREAFRYLNEVKKGFSKRKFLNTQTGNVDLRFNPLSPDENIYIPISREQDRTRIETLAQPTWETMEIVEYFLKKMYSALKVPRQYLGGDSDKGGSILSNVDVQFARSVLRVQREIRRGLRHIARVHLSALEIDPASAYHEIYLTVPSGVYELAQLEVANARADFASRMREFVSLEWVLKEIFGHTDVDIQRIKEQRGAEVQAEKAALGESGYLAKLLGEESKEHDRLSKKDMAALKKNVMQILHEDRELAGHMREVRGLLREISFHGKRNGASSTLPPTGGRFTLSGN